MVKCVELVDYLNQLLNINQFKDASPNGLQIQGSDTINTLVSGVTASEALIDAAITAKADAVLVHHGYFWNNEETRIVGIKHTRIKKLLQHNINLLAYHLPLDVHAVFGNNIQLAHLLGIKFIKTIEVAPGLPLLNLGEVFPLSGIELSQLLEKRLSRQPLHISNRKDKIKTIAWCTGAGQDYISIAVANGAQAYITGEVSERTFHIARETGIDFFAAGHHATERYGVIALGEHVSKHFNLHHHYVEIENPI